MPRFPLSRLPRGPRRPDLAFFALALAFAPSPARAAYTGAWSDFVVFPIGEYIGAMTPADGSGQNFWVASSVSAGGINPATGNPYLRSSVRLFSTTSGSGPDLPYDGLDNSEHDAAAVGIVRPRLAPYPMLIQTLLTLRAGHAEPDHSPYLYNFDPSLGQWTPAVLPSGEQSSWPGPPSATTIYDDLGDVLICGNHRVMATSDGVTWSQRSDLNTFFAPPPPYQSGYGAGGLPAWLPAPQGLSNQPRFDIYTPGWQTGFARMPWGELFVGGEQGSYFHSLDNGFTWEWFDPLINQPIRDAQHQPLFRHPRTFRLAQTFGIGATGDGEVILHCKNNNGHHYFLWNSTGQLMNVDAGMPGPTGGVEPGICRRFVTDPATGETYMLNLWTGQNLKPPLPTPTGRSTDLYRYDGNSWALVEPPAGYEFEPFGGFFADATGLIVPARQTEAITSHSLLRWNPDLSAAPPPAVSIQGGDSATNAPSVTLSAATGRAALVLSASVAAANAVSCQWSARGPGPVLFEDSRAASPRAWFSVVGDYVLNLRVRDSVTGAHRGASVIVHVRPAPGGAAPAIITQPANTVIAASGSTPYALSVVASGPGPFTYQWKRDGIDVVSPSARTATLTGVATAADLGATFHCVVGNPHGTVASHTALLGFAPTLVGSPVSQTVSAGQYAVFGVAARGAEPMTWQWRLNGAPIAGATRASFAANVPGSYSVDVTNVFGTVTSAAATLAVGTPGATAPLQLLPDASNAPSGGDAYLDTGATINPVYPVGQPIPLSVERTPYGYGPIFLQWQVTGLTAGNSYVLSSPTLPQTTLTITGPGQAASFRVSAVYKDAASLPFHALSVVNGYGTGEYREGWNFTTNTSAGAPTATIEALPAPPGMVFDRWSGGAIFADSHAALTTATLPSIRSTVTARYLAAVEAWRNARFGASATNAAIAGDNADPDGDGRPNLLEYAFGLDPLVVDAPASSSAAQPALAANPAASGALEFSFTRDLAATDLTYVVQVSDDLATWADASSFSTAAGDTPDSAATILVSRATASGRETIIVRDARPISAGARRFFRLRVAHP